ncbi:MAG: GNAT family N-acetyltransferase [Capsulimonas sp.]|uniref:GNAT family N-acetyltransferase n=1 Tax=Capsulimonas sp. TaxID=2494211 RepID=UPI00326572FA
MPDFSDQFENFDRALAQSPHYRPAEAKRFSMNARTGIGKLATTSTALGHWFGLLTRLDFDSRLFGIEEARLEPIIVPECFSPLTLDILAQSNEFVESVIANARKAGIDHITAPVKTRDSFALIVLQHAGFTMSDTMIVHAIDLATFEAAPRTSTIRQARSDDSDALERISAECFGSRRYNANRFNCDPAFHPAGVESLYRQWAVKSVNKTMADEVLVYEMDGAIAGFITVSMTSNVAAIPLNAVAPEYQGRGVYTALVKAALAMLKERGASTVEIRTQLANLAVHQTWRRLGASIVDAHHTLRCRIATS